jgi:ABC-type ATPase with predicted acetyltransferase domain
MRVTVAHEFLPKTATVRTSRVMDHFGIAFEQGRHVLADDLELPIQPGQVVLFTGESGAGKSSLMRAAATELRNLSEPSAGVLNIDELSLGDEPLIDALPIDAIEAMELLAQCGLGEARLLLRKPAELSDGQRYRFRLALGLAQRPQWLVADEFTATLDRTLAKVVAYNVRRLADRTGTGVLLATTHDDVAADLAPDLHIRCRLDGQIECIGQNAKPSPDGEPPSPPRKKKDSSPSPMTCALPRRPAPTGRTLLGGITAAMNSR